MYPGLRYLYPTNADELHALFSILLFAGVIKNNLVPVDDVFNSIYEPSIFQATISARIFEFLLNCLRFDDWHLHLPGLPQPEDKFSPIWEIWEKFLVARRLNYVPSHQITIDETMLRFFGMGCGFRTYLPRKPDRFGLKIMSLVDAKTFYYLNRTPYLGVRAEERWEVTQETRKTLRAARKTAAPTYQVCLS